MELFCECTSYHSTVNILSGNISRFSVTVQSLATPSESRSEREKDKKHAINDQRITSKKVFAFASSLARCELALKWPMVNYGFQVFFKNPGQEAYMW